VSAHVYRAYDATGRLLYVGCTVDLDARLRAHSEHSPWWLFHSEVTSEQFPTQDAALEAEAFAILTEHPRWNMRGRDPEHPDGKTHDSSAPWLAYEMGVWRRWIKAEGDRQRLAKESRDNAARRRTLLVEIEMVKTGAFSDEDLTAAVDA
jgi:hypothetical protein